MGWAFCSPLVNNCLISNISCLDKLKFTPCTFLFYRTSIEKETECSVLPASGSRWIGLRTFTENTSVPVMGTKTPQPLHAVVTAWCPADALQGFIEIPSRIKTRRNKMVDEMMSEWVGDMPDSFRSRAQSLLDSQVVITHAQVNLDCSSLWGLCPHEMMSQNECEKLLENVISEHVREIVFYLDKDDPLQGLLESLSRTTKPSKNLGCIVLWGGKVDHGYLQQWVSTYPDGGIGVDMYYTNIVVSNNADKPMPNTGKLRVIEPTYVTQDGAKVVLEPVTPVTGGASAFPS